MMDAIHSFSKERTDEGNTEMEREVLKAVHRYCMYDSVMFITYIMWEANQSKQQVENYHQFGPI